MRLCCVLSRWKLVVDEMAHAGRSRTLTELRNFIAGRLGTPYRAINLDPFSPFSFGDFYLNETVKTSKLNILLYLHFLKGYPIDVHLSNAAFMQVIAISFKPS